jgi:hypothetical protein
VNALGRVVLVRLSRTEISPLAILRNAMKSQQEDQKSLGAPQILTPLTQPPMDVRITCLKMAVQKETVQKAVDHRAAVLGAADQRVVDLKAAVRIAADLKITAVNAILPQNPPAKPSSIANH